MGAFEKLAKLDRRWVFLAMGIAVILPFLRPVGVAILPSPPVESFYAAIEGVEPGGTIYLAADLDPGAQAELLPMLDVAVTQACRRNLRIVAASLWPAAPPIVEEVLRRVAIEEHGKVYGQDVVNLGFKEGREAVMVMVAQRLAAAYPADYYGTPIERIPLLSDVESFEDIDLVVSISAGYPGTKEWVQQVRSRYPVAMVSGCTAVSAPEYYPYVQSGQLSGLLGGLAGAAEYEKLAGIDGDASRGMDSQSLGHLAVVFFIVAGNVIHLLSRRGRPA